MLYENAFRVADGGYYNGRVDSIRKNWKTQWRHWCTFVASLWVGPELQDTPLRGKVRRLSGFGGLVRIGYFGRGKQVQASTVASAITAVGKTIALAHQVNPTKMPHSDKLLIRLQEMLTGFRKENPATNKKSPIEVDLPKFLAALGCCKGALELLKSIGDCALMAYY